jgi:hypothetical protein
MDEFSLKRQFESIGASVKFQALPNLTTGRQHRRITYLLNVEARPRGEVFTFACRPAERDQLVVQAVDIRPRERHLLLLVRVFEQKDKYLCGHDERHLFVAGLPENSIVRNVPEAFGALKPVGVLASLQKERVPNKHANRRRNKGFYRQGEWFFVPRPDFAPEYAAWILRNEPIRRGRSKPHVVEELCRLDGETVYVCEAYPNGLTEEEYRQMLGRKPHARAWVWRTRRRKMRVFARGKVRHPDHKTLILPGWYEVLMSAERMDETVVFLD